MLRTRSVGSPPSPRDGLRVLVTRFRGRGLPVDRYDVWLPSLGPSEKLLRSFLADEIDWRAFATRYRAQLFAPSGSDGENRTIKDHGQKSALRLLAHLAGRGDVTLLCHCAEDALHCHRHLLAKILASRSL
jgi:uncharacterized protein YeaO (DUF488 family)